MNLWVVFNDIYDDDKEIVTETKIIGVFDTVEKAMEVRNKYTYGSIIRVLMNKEQSRSVSSYLGN